MDFQFNKRISKLPNIQNNVETYNTIMNFQKYLADENLEVSVDKLKDIKKSIMNFLTWCKIKQLSQIDFQMVPSYFDLCAAILSYFIDISAILNRNIEKNVNKVAELLCSQVMLSVSPCYSYSLDALLQTRHIKVNDKNTILPFVRKSLEEVKINNNLVYTKYLCAVYQFSQLWPFDLKDILKKALKLKPPQEYLNWLKEKDKSLFNLFFKHKLKLSSYILKSNENLINKLLQVLVVESTFSNSNNYNETFDLSDEAKKKEFIIDKKGNMFTQKSMESNDYLKSLYNEISTFQNDDIGNHSFTENILIESINIDCNSNNDNKMDTGCDGEGLTDSSYVNHFINEDEHIVKDKQVYNDSKNMDDVLFHNKTLNKFEKDNHLTTMTGNSDLCLNVDMSTNIDALNKNFDNSDSFDVIKANECLKVITEKVNTSNTTIQEKVTMPLNKNNLIFQHNNHIFNFNSTSLNKCIYDSESNFLNQRDNYLKYDESSDKIKNKDYSSEIFSVDELSKEYSNNSEKTNIYNYMNLENKQESRLKKNQICISPCTSENYTLIKTHSLSSIIDKRFLEMKSDILINNIHNEKETEKDGDYGSFKANKCLFRKVKSQEIGVVNFYKNNEINNCENHSKTDRNINGASSNDKINDLANLVVCMSPIQLKEIYNDLNSTKDTNTSLQTQLVVNSQNSKTINECSNKTNLANESLIENIDYNDITSEDLVCSQVNDLNRSICSDTFTQTELSGSYISQLESLITSNIYNPKDHLIESSIKNDPRVITIDDALVENSLNKINKDNVKEKNSKTNSWRKRSLSGCVSYIQLTQDNTECKQSLQTAINDINKPDVNNLISSTSDSIDMKQFNRRQSKPVDSKKMKITKKSAEKNKLNCENVNKYSILKNNINLDDSSFIVDKGRLLRRSPRIKMKQEHHY